MMICIYGTFLPLIVGYARVGSVCSLDSVSVIEDHGGFQSINAAAHELGHGYDAKISVMYIS